MKFVILALFLSALLCVVVALVMRAMINSSIQETVTGPNYMVRFNPGNNKYYLVNARPTKDIPFTTFWGTRKYYSDRTQAEVVLQKLKGNFV